MPSYSLYIYCQSTDGEKRTGGEIFKIFFHSNFPFLKKNLSYAQYDLRSNLQVKTAASY